MQLGDKMKSKVTGFTGIAIGYVVFFNGCDRFNLQPPVDKDGKDQDALWVDTQELEVVERQCVASPVPRPEKANAIPPSWSERLLARVGGRATNGGGENPPGGKHDL